MAIRVLTARGRTHFTTAEIAAEIDERMGPWNVRRHVDALEGAGYLVNTTPERARNHRYQVAPRIMEGDHVLASGESWLGWMERVLSGPTVPRERLAERLYELGVEVAHRRREHAAQEPGVDPAPQPTLLSMYDAAVRAPRPGGRGGAACSPPRAK